MPTNNHSRPFLINLLKVNDRQYFGYHIFIDLFLINRFNSKCKIPAFMQQIVGHIHRTSFFVKMSPLFVMVPTVSWCACLRCVTLEVVGKNAAEPGESVAASHNLRRPSHYAVLKSRLTDFSAAIIWSPRNMTTNLSSL